MLPLSFTRVEIKGLEFMIKGLEFKIKGLEFKIKIKGLEFKIKGLEFKIKGLEFKICKGQPFFELAIFTGTPSFFPVFV